MRISEKEKALRREWLEEYLKVRERWEECYTFGYTLPASWDVFFSTRLKTPQDHAEKVVPFMVHVFDVIESLDDAPWTYHDVELSGEIRDFNGHNVYMITSPETAKNLGPFWNNLEIKDDRGALLLDDGHLLDTYGITLRQAQILAELDKPNL